MSLKDPSLSRSFTICGSQLEYIDNDTLLYKCGNSIVIFNTAVKSQSIISFEEGYSLDSFSVNFQTKIVACAVHGKAPKILMYQFPSTHVLHAIDGGVELGFSHICLSRNGKYMLTVSKIPTPMLAYWDMKSYTKIAETMLGNEEIQFVSFNPRSRKQFVLGNQKKLSIWTIDCKFENYSFSKSEFHFDNDLPREILCHAWTADDRIYVGSPFGEVLVTDTKSKLLTIVNQDSSIDCPIYCMLLTRNHLIVTAENGFIYWLSTDNFELHYVKDSSSKGIFTAAFSPNYSSIVAVDLSGQMFSITFAGDNAVLTEDNRSNDKWVSLTTVQRLPLSINIFTRIPVSFGITSSPVSTRFISYGNDGSFSVWDYMSNELLGSNFFQSPVTCCVYCPDDILAAAGFENGALGILDVKYPEKMRLLYLERLHDGPVVSVKFSKSGLLVATIGKDNRLFIFRVADLTLLGYKEIPFDVVTIQWLSFSDLEYLIVTSNYGQCCILTPPTVNFVPTATLSFPDDLKASIVDMGIAATALCPDSHQEKLLFALTLDKKLKRFEWNPKGTVELKSQYEGHAKFGKCVALSPDFRFLASGAADGSVMIRRTDNLFALVKLFPHDYNVGGVNNVCFSADSRFLLTCGADGGIFCWSLNLPVRRDLILPDAIPAVIHSSILKEIQTVDESELDSVSFSKKIQSKHSMFLSNEQTEKQSQLNQEVKKVKDSFLQILHENSTIDDVEKLDRSEFIIDHEFVSKIINDGDVQAQLVIENAGVENLGKELVAHRIKAQCWDNMETKGTALASFKSQLTVPNFPIRKLSGNELAVFEKVVFNRKIELAQASYDRSNGIFVLDLGSEITRGIDYIININDKYPNELLYHPADCVTEQRKSTQVILLQSRIDDIKRAFNSKFKSHYELKQSEIYRLEEKADRLAEIFSELKIDDTCYRPTWTSDELPENIFVVSDSEITAEKVLSDREREKLEQDERERQERLKRQAEDDSRDRALKDMMGGTLNLNKDSSLLDASAAFKKEEWMKLPITEMSEEQKMLFQEFEKKEKIFLQERENKRKLLETESKKLKNECNDICRLFDEKLQILFEERLDVQKMIYLQELMISKLLNETVEEESRDAEEVALVKREKDILLEKSKATHALNEFRKRVDVQNRKCEQLSKEDKDFDKQVKKELIDVAPDFSDLLFKFYKSKKSRKSVVGPLVPVAPAVLAPAPSILTKRVSRRVGSIVSKSLAKPDLESRDDDNEYSQVNTVEGEVIAKLAVENEFALENSEKPEEVPAEIWSRLNQLRGIKTDKEVELKAALTTLEEMKTHESNLAITEKALNDELMSTLNRKNVLKEQRALHQLNSELFLTVKQGQVEIDEAPVVTDLSNAILVHRSIVEELNKTIITLGTEKVTQLKEIHSVKKAIAELKWHQQMLEIEHEEYVDRTTDFQLLRVTKDLQELIKVGGYDEKQKAEIDNLEKKMEYLQQVTDDRVRDRGQKVQKVLDKVRSNQVENEKLFETVNQLKQSVAERENVIKIRQVDDSGETSATRKRVDAIIEKRRLIDLSKAQQEEIRFLTAELSKCRQKTFPSFQQLVPLPLANPDVITRRR